MNSPSVIDPVLHATRGSRAGHATVSAATMRDTWGRPSLPERSAPTRRLPRNPAAPVTSIFMARYVTVRHVHTPLKVSVVTGAGTGIGKAVAIGLLEQGYAVVLAGRRADRLGHALRDAGASGERGLPLP